jgi:geranylgeranyl pyrophosphate synthase
MEKYATLEVTSMDYTRVLDSLGGIIEDDLKKQLKRAAKDGTDYHPFMGEVYEALGEFVLRGGRRLASCSTLIVYRGYTGQIDDKITKACTGIELYRHSILVHDDIVDAEMLRRGGKTLHMLLKEGYDERFGVGSAIFVGDMLYSLAVGAVLESGFDNNKLTDVVRLLSSDYRDVNESQILDLLFEYKEPNVDEWSIMTSKRASSLFRTSMLAGAILASASVKDKMILEDAARHIGYAFDIQDDIIDTFASKEQYGRESGGDIVKRKKPLHMILAMNKDRRVASMMSRDVELTSGAISEIKELIRACGALDEAKSISREHGKEAERLISLTDMDSEAKDFFISFINYVGGSLDWYK